MYVCMYVFHEKYPTPANVSKSSFDEFKQKLCVCGIINDIIVTF